MFLSIIALITFIAMLAVNYLANSLPIGGNTTGDISGAYNSLFTPAGFTFSIWGLIYTLLIIFVILLFTNPTLVSENKEKILLLFSGINILNIVWLLTWHNDKIVLSTIVMLFLLTALLITLTSIARTDTFPFITFSIYAGWISVATVANISIMLVKLDYSLFMNHQQLWFGLVLGVTLLIGLYMLIKEKNPYYTGVFLWAYLGIVSKFI
jgi:tryptophan-rich sensory protein